MIKNIARYSLNRAHKLKICFLKNLPLSKINDINEEFISSLKTNKEESLEIILFSKDRPIQLLALLESLEHYGSPKILPYIIYNAKDEAYQHAYDELFSRHSHLFKKAISDKELGFKKALTDLLLELKSTKVTFLVDDIVLKNKVDWNELLHFDTEKVVPSIRLAPHLKRCYTANDKQSTPPLKYVPPFYWWYWNEGDHDWKYPLSVDGNIFSRTKFLDMISKIDFKAPNTLELRLQKFKDEFLPKLGCCYAESIILNVPANKVQDEINNIHGKVHQEDLLKLWNENKKINFLKYHAMKNISCHQEVDFEFIPRS